MAFVFVSLYGTILGAVNNFKNLTIAIIANWLHDVHCGTIFWDGRSAKHV